MDKMSRKELIRKMQEVGFAAVELNLYLDNNPCDERALRDYNTISCEYMNLKKMYEHMYGPISNFGHINTAYPWTWTEEPWPWQIGE